MTNNQPKQRMILCGGLQSGGTTLISWCFLQRRDANGVLDMVHDIVRASFDEVREPVLWVKMTIGAFRWLDVFELYRDLGWEPTPLLIVRDARAAYASLLKKDYGKNGTTAEEPPLRTRFRRFLRDWELFRARRWPIIKYEDFLQDERAVLQRSCQALGLPWDEGMISWRKELSDIAYVNEPNRTFARSIAKGSLGAAMLPEKAAIQIDNLPPSELAWLEETFAAYNAVHAYPAHVAPAADKGLPAALPPPSFENTIRHWYLSEIERLQRELDVLQEKGKCRD